MAADRRIPILRLLADRWPALEQKELYSAILCGEVYIGDERIRDPKTPVPASAEPTLVRNRYVGRGGEKLAGALDALGIDPSGRVCLDAGASTGGFTDCLLARGARIVHAVDVGYNQVAWKLRSDPRVRLRERTNLMHLFRSELNPPPDFAVADLAFRSLRGAASHLLDITAGRPVLALAKPQFEGPPSAEFDGVIRSGELRTRVMMSLREDLLRESVRIIDAAASKITGKKGNAEIFLLLSRNPPDDEFRAEERLRRALEDADERAGL